MGYKTEEIERVIGISKLNFGNDKTYDLAPESYLQAANDFSNTFEITTNLLQAFINREKHTSKILSKQSDTEILQVFDISEFFTEIRRGKCKPINSLKEGNMPVVTTTELNNGIVGYYDIEKKLIDNDAITISANGSSCCAFYHPYEFTANADVLICKMKKKYDNLYFKLFMCTAIRSSAWKFTYYRKCSQTKLLKDVKIKIPVKNNEIDFAYIKHNVENSVGFSILQKYL